MAQQAQKKLPAIRGLRWHRHQYFSFFVPEDWHRSNVDASPARVIYSPDPDDIATLFAVELQDLGTALEPSDLEVLAEGFFETIARLPQVEIQTHKMKASGSIIEMEAKYTFSEAGATRKRWTRVLYQDTRQIALNAQGATPEIYDYWLPMFFESMSTARIHRQEPSLELFL